MNYVNLVGRLNVKEEGMSLLDILAMGAAVPWLVVAMTRREFGARAGWQAGLLALLLLGMRRRSANARYVVGCAGMLLMIAAAGGTFCFLPEPPVGYGSDQASPAATTAAKMVTRGLKR